MTTNASVTTAVQPDPPLVTLRSPADLVAATPYLLGFHPADSVVVVAFRGKGVVFAARGDLPGPDHPPETVVGSMLDVVRRQDTDAVAMLGYGPAAAVVPVLELLRERAEQLDLPVKDMLRVHEGRWRSIVCDDPDCCPPEGTPVDLATNAVSARLTFEGLTAAPSRQDREREVAPVDGPARTAMNQATDRAERRLGSLLADLPPGQWEGAMLAEGTAAVGAAITRYAEGGQLDDGELAWLSVLLDAHPVRDLAWQSITSEQPHLRLWTDVTRRADPALAAPPASLLAFTAWRFGDGVLAGLALERALLTNPSYSLAHLLLQGLRQGPPPAALDDWGTPAWPGRMQPGPSGHRQPVPRHRKRRRGPGRGRRGRPVRARGGR